MIELVHIGIIAPYRKLVGGGPRLTLELANALQRSGHTVGYYTLRDPKTHETYYTDLVERIEIRALPRGFRLKPPWYLRIPIRGLSTIQTYLNEHRVAAALARLIDPTTEALNPHSTRIGYLAAYYFNTINRRRLPILWHMNDVQLLTEKLCAPTAGESHTRCGRARELLYRAIDAIDGRRYLVSVDRIAVLADTVRVRAAATMGRDCTVLRPGVGSDRFTYRPRSGPLHDPVRLVAHAQFFLHRRFEDAIRALKLLADQGVRAVLTVSGDCQTYRVLREYRERLEALASQLGVRDRVSFPGKLTEDALVAEFHASDIFLCPHHKQSWGLVAFEAIATGLPAIVSRESGAHEVLADGTTALLVDARAPEQIASAALRLIREAGLYERISRAGAEFVRSAMTWDAYAGRVAEIFEGIRRGRAQRP